jgi:hypothetical protein
MSELILKKPNHQFADDNIFKTKGVLPFLHLLKYAVRKVTELIDTQTAVHITG